ESSAPHNLFAPARCPHRYSDAIGPSLTRFYSSGCFRKTLWVGVRRFRKVSGATYAVVGRRWVHRSETEQSLEGCHGLPTAIVPKDELVQIDLQLGAANPVVSAYEPLLEVADGAISKRHHGFGSLTQLD